MLQFLVLARLPADTMVMAVTARWTDSAASGQRCCLPRAPGPELRCPRHLQCPKTHPLPPKTSTTSLQPPSFLPGTRTLLFLLLGSRPPCSHPRARGQCWGGDRAGHPVSQPPPAPAPQSGQFPSLTGGGRIPVPTVTSVSPTSPCCRFRVGNRDPHVWGVPQPPPALQGTVGVQGHEGDMGIPCCHPGGN